MFSKVLIISVFCILFFAIESYAQELRSKIVPLKSRRENVITAYGKGEQIETGKVRYEFPEEEIIITYYESGCGMSEEQKLGVSSGMVIQVKVIPKIQQRIVDLFDVFPYEKTYSAADDVVYMSLRERIIITSKKTNDEEVIKAFYYVPEKKGLPLCILDRMEGVPGYVLYKEHPRNDDPAESNVSPIQIGNFSNSDALSSRRIYLDELAKQLKVFPHFIGYILVYKNKRTTQKEFELYVQELKTYLIGEKQISSDRLIFIDAGSGKKAMTKLIAFPKEYAPKPNAPVL